MIQHVLRNVGGLRAEIEAAVNRASAENGSNTPDFILAEYLIDALVAFDKAVNAREAWCGRGPRSIPEGQVFVDPHEPTWNPPVYPMHAEGISETHG